MALSTARLSFLKQRCMKNWLTTAKLGPTTGMFENSVFVASPIQVATLKATYGEKYPYQKPFPYEKKKLNVLTEFLDFNCLERLNENSKVICIEGNIGVGKKDFAKKLARAFDLKYIPPVTDTDVFSGESGYDERMIDDMVSEESRCYDLKKLLSDPNPRLGIPGFLQVGYLREKFITYAQALLHLLSTGQGIVVVRSPHSDEVFAEAMKRLGWISRQGFRFYTDIRANAICEILRPHITLFLDAPVETCMERILARKDPRELGGEENLNKLLPAIESVYKDFWLLKEREDHEVLEIDWTEVGDEMDMDVIAEELEGLTLQCDNADDPMFKDWSNWTRDRIAECRYTYSRRPEMAHFFYRHTQWDAPETYRSLDACTERAWVFERHPLFDQKRGTAKELGYNTDWKLF